MDIASTTTLSSLLSDSGSAASKRLTLTMRRDDTKTANASAATVSNDDAASFADAIMAQLQSALASNAGSLTATAGADLDKALADTVVYVRDNFGNAAATTVMGLIAKGVGNGQGGEDAMGNALLSSLQFIDSTFGIAAGDKAIAKFNGALNDAVNAYFQNGHDEVFYASDGTATGGNPLAASLSATLSSVADTFGQDAADLVSDLIDKSLSTTGLTREGLSTALQEASSTLGETYGASLDLGAGLALAGAPVRGSVLDVTV